MFFGRGARCPDVEDQGRLTNYRLDRTVGGVVVCQRRLLQLRGAGLASGSAGFAGQSFMDKHLQQSLVAKAFALCQLSGLGEIGFL
jgi:hypothetical protein